MRTSQRRASKTSRRLCALAGVLGQQAEVGHDELPLGVGDVAGVGLVSDHTLNYVADWTKVHNTL